MKKCLGTINYTLKNNRGGLIYLYKMGEFCLFIEILYPSEI